MLLLAASAAAILVDLGQVPNQLLKFAGQNVSAARSEDAIVAYTWDRFLRTGERGGPRACR